MRTRGNLMARETPLERLRAEMGFNAVIVVTQTGDIKASARSDEIYPEALDMLYEMATRITSSDEEKARLAASGDSLHLDDAGQQFVAAWLKTDPPLIVVILAPPGTAYKRALGRIAKRFS